MFQDFDKMPLQSRIWIYQANRSLTAKEENMTMYTLKNALEQWNAHGAPLLASAKVAKSRFVIVALDESQNQASGCSIDASTHWLKKIGSDLGIDFFDRSISFENDNQISSVDIFSLKKAIEESVITADTMVFNNNVNTVSELLGQWKVAASKLPFLAKYFKKQVA